MLVTWLLLHRQGKSHHNWPIHGDIKLTAVLDRIYISGTIDPLPQLNCASWGHPDQRRDPWGSRTTCAGICHVTRWHTKSYSDNPLKKTQIKSNLTSVADTRTRTPLSTGGLLHKPDLLVQGFECPCRYEAVFTVVAFMMSWITPWSQWPPLNCMLLATHSFPFTYSLSHFLKFLYFFTEFDSLVQVSWSVLSVSKSDQYELTAGKSWEALLTVFREQSECDLFDQAH